MEEKLIAPCGMNCELSVHYQANKNDLQKQGFHRKYCEGCIPRGENCLHMGDRCEKMANGTVRFCYECQDFPCKPLKGLDKRYRDKYHMSMIDNLIEIKERGIEAFLVSQEEKWKCSDCGGTICCHNGLCLSCNTDTLRQNKRYRWGEQ